MRKMNYEDVDNMITAFLREKGYKLPERGYQSQQENMWYNDTCYDFRIRPVPLGKDEEGLPYIGDILNWMCAEGKMDSGELIIKVCW